MDRTKRFIRLRFQYSDGVMLPGRSSDAVCQPFPDPGDLPGTRFAPKLDHGFGGA